MAENINVEEFAEALRQLADHTRNASEALAGASPAAKALAQAQADSAKQKAAQDAAIAKAANEAKQALSSFGKAVMEGGGDLNKYGSSVEGFGSAVGTATAGMGPLARSVGLAVEGFTKLAAAVFTQTDNLLKANDQLSKLGAANSFSTDVIQQMGARAGLTSKELDKMIKPMQSLQGGLGLIGSTAAESVKNFSDMIAVTKETRQEFQRLGLNDAERIQAQTDYLSLMEKSGAVLIGQQKTGKGLQESSLEYTKNLYELSAMTGKNVEQMKGEQEVARANIQWQLQENKWARDKQAAMAKGDQAEVGRIEREQKAANRLVDDMMAAGGKAAAAGIQMQYLTGAVTKQSSQFSLMGFDAQKQIDAAKKGDYQRGKAADEYTKAQQGYIDTVGHANLALSEQGRNAIKLDEDALKRQNVQIGRDGAEAAAKDARNKLEANQQGKGAAAEDNAQKTRNLLTEAEREAKLVIDGFVKAANPFVSGVTGSTVALAGLGIAAIAAAKALGQIAMSKLPGGAGPTAPGPGGGGGRMGTALKGGAAALGGMALMSAGSAAKEAGNAKTGAALDIAGQAASYAGTGAMLGSFIPGIGTAAGAIVGGLVGAGMGMYQNRDVFGGGAAAAGGAEGSATQSNPISEVMSYGDGYNVVKRPDGKVERQSGARNWRNNNPGNIEYGDFSKRYGAIGSDGRFAVFPSYEAGRQAKSALVFEGKNYSGLDLRSAIFRYAPPSENNSEQYFQSVLTSVGGKNKRMGEYDSGERDSILSAMERMEGFKQGKVTQVSARDGGIASGSDMGYPATLHGTEVIKRLDPGSILEYIAKTPMTEVGGTTGKASTTEVLVDLKDIQSQLYSMMSEKFDEMISALTTGNDTRSKILTYSMV